MYNYYKGNSGVKRKIQEPEASEKRDFKNPARNKSAPSGNEKRPPLQNPSKKSGLPELLGSFFPGKLQSLETEDIILLLMLYLMYRDSGDSELLIIMGALLFF